MAPTVQNKGGKPAKMSLQDLFQEQASLKSKAAAPEGFWENQEQRKPVTNATLRVPTAATQKSAEDSAKAAACELASTASGGAASNAEELAALSVQQLKELNTFGVLADAAATGSSTAIREAALDLLASLGGAAGEGACDAEAAAALGSVQECLAHKEARVTKAAGKAVEALATALGDAAFTKVLEGIYACINGSTWQSKQASLLLLSALAAAAPLSVAAHLVEVVPNVTHAMLDARGEVKKAAHAAMLVACATTPNTDLQPFVPDLVGCIVRPADTANVIDKVACKTFVQPIDGGCLAIMVPLLIKGLRVTGPGSSATRRKGCIIVENMAKLVSDPREALSFLPKLLPDVIKVSQEASDPELRAVASRAHDSLVAVEQAAERRKNAATVGPTGPAPGPRVAGQQLCDCTFSLAYGARILLHNTTLSLIRGQRYGLCGHNGAGKSTLMRAIASGQLDGFPPPEMLRTVYVEHDIDASLSQVCVVDFVHQDPAVKRTTAPPREKVVEMLSSVGFDEQKQAAPLVSLSGGWKMKLALARAMLMDPDVLLLDEPTNHLDVTNVKWLEDYLNGLQEVSVMVVSHDSGFLDNVTTDIIHYENKRLVHYPGNLSAFVEVRPEAKAYYDLSQATLKFVFPKPSFLEGIKTNTQSIVKVQGAAFTYPGTERQILRDVTVKCTLSSRVHVKGANGAGKSTLIKMITGETDPTTGAVWRHPNCRIAYVAQHAFHHVEQHLDKTPAQYLWWRYEKGEDKEAAKKASRNMSAEEMAKHEEAAKKGQKVPEELVGRRAHRGDFEYEVKWLLLPEKHNSWVARKELVEMGFEKQVNDLDARIAQSKVYRPLSTEAVNAHLADFGIDEELAQHNKIRGMSGGQKVKLVLASAMWNNAHMLVLDEPTNYLDRDSLGALATAINEYAGAVVMITHSQEMADTVCTETWLVEGGICAVTKKADAAGAAGAGAAAAGEEVPDADAAELEETIRQKALAKEEKRRIAKEKAAKRAEDKKKKYEKKF